MTTALRDDQLDPATLKDHHTRTSITTQSGVEFFPFEPKMADVRLEDLAHALANKCRFTGHTRFHYSVAQHSVLVARLAWRRGMSRDLQAWGLLHDATEAYLPDVASPLKGSLGVLVDRDTPAGVFEEYEPFKVAEHRLCATIAARFGLDCNEPPEIKVLDGQMYRAERHALMPVVEWSTTPAPDDDVPPILEWSIDSAEQAFLMAAGKLGLN